VLLSCKVGNNPHPVVVVETSYGDIVMELYPDKAPKTVGNFLRYVDAGVYKRSNFYRILSTENQPMGTNAAELIQGGLWANKAAKDTFPPTPHETTQQTGLKHLHGTVSLARQEPGTGSTEFFICIGDQPGFDYGGENNADGQGYAAFGKVIEGMEVVQKIYRQPEENQFFNPPIPIINIKRK
jgi:peptidyl-prolyl cis-trans isomerase A (cyclophilin A)